MEQLFARCPVLCPIPFTLAWLALFSQQPAHAQVSIREAVEAASKHFGLILNPPPQANFGDSCAEVALTRGMETTSLAESSAWAGSQGASSDLDAASWPLRRPPAIGLSAESAGTQSRLPGPLRVVGREQQMLCTALAFITLTTINSQTKIWLDQQMAADRLVETETRRASKGIDDPIVLTRAKLLQARARAQGATLERSELRVRKQLADLAGLPMEHIKSVSNSMAPMPEASITDPESHLAMRQLIAARDVAQLEQALAHTQRMGTRGRLGVGKATVGDLLTAYVTEQEKLLVLLGANLNLQIARIYLLGATGALEPWVLGSPAVPTENLSGEATPRGPASVAARARPSIRWIMITPGVSTLLTGESQKFSAIAIYDDGHAKDATLEATWQCSSDRDAVVSNSGLVTALAAGQVAITATVSSVRQTRQMEIAAYGIDSLLKQ